MKTGRRLLLGAQTRIATRVKVPSSATRVRIQHEVMALEMTVRSTHLDDGTFT